MLTKARRLLTRSITLRTFGVVIVLAGIAKISGLLKEMVVAARFGAGAPLDAYLFLFNILSTPASMWFSTISAVLIPHLIMLERRSPEEAAHFRAEFMMFATVIGVAVGLLSWLGLYAYVATGASGLGVAATGYAGDVLPYLWLMVPLLFVAQYGSSCLMARNLHVNSLYEGLPALTILVALLVFEASIKVMVLSTVAGFALQLIATIFSLARSGNLGRPLASFQSGAWRQLRSAFLVMAGVQFLQSATNVVDQVIAAQLPTGSLSRLSYTLRAQGVLLTLLALAVPRVLLPALSSMSHAAPEEMKRFVGRWTLLLGTVGGITAIVVSALSEPIVRFLFQRGSFTVADTEAVATLLAVMIWQLPFYLLAMLYSQLQIVTRNYASLAIMGVGTLIIKLALGLPLVWWSGLIGLIASIPVVTAFQVVILVLLGRRSQVGQR